MRPRRISSCDHEIELFDEAIREHALAVVTAHDGATWHTFKSRFLERDPKRQFFVLDYQSVTGQPLPELLTGQFVGVTFRSRSRKILFSTCVEAKGHYVLDAKTSVAAVRYRWPESVTEMQRRAYYRTPIPAPQAVPATLWAGGLAARGGGGALPADATHGQLADISCGGAMVRLNALQAPSWTEEQVLGVELHLPDSKGPVAVDCYFRGVRADGQGQTAVAIQFVGLEMSVDGRLVLERLVNCVQRFGRMAMPMVDSRLRSTG
ncbi:Flagellar brake protein YcgR [Phycisphaerae bacterium RAS1]|nr:Flagellar brake protein YcgR [Phycisphaerae bacterium RAS1]